MRSCAATASASDREAEGAQLGRQGSGLCERPDVKRVAADARWCLAGVEPVRRLGRDPLIELNRAINLPFAPSGAPHVSTADGDKDVALLDSIGDGAFQEVQWQVIVFELVVVGR